MLTNNEIKLLGYMKGEPIMSNGWKCDKCGHYFETPRKHEVRTYEDNSAWSDKQFDLCDECKQRFDKWIESTPYLGTEYQFLVLDEAAYLSKDSMPYGWPIFEDGTPIKEGDEVLDGYGHGFVAHNFSHYGKYWIVSSGHGYSARSDTWVFKRPTKDQMAIYYKKYQDEQKEKKQQPNYVTYDGAKWKSIGYVADGKPIGYVADGKPIGYVADDMFKPNPFVGLVRGKHWERHEASDYYCGRCGWKVTDHDSYCPECGGALHGGNVPKNRENTNEDVNHPKHYDNGKVECIDWIEEMLTPEEFRGYLKGAALKYQFRCENKEDAQKDLEKAKWYISKLKERLSL